MANTARVFPRKTEATPTDELAFANCPPPLLTLPEIDEVHISVAFTYDIPRAEELAYQWEVVGVPVKVGGPAYNEPGGEFIPGRYLKHPSQYCPVRERRMDIVEHPDETRQTVLTLLASEPFDGIVEVEQGPPVPEDFVPLKIEPAEIGGDEGA